MLTRAQIQHLAQRNHIGLQAQERDYLQHLLLFSLYNRSQALVFKGGTALRLAYQGNRYSEDLDFNGPADVATIRGLWDGVLQDLGDFGLMAERRYEWRSEAGYSFDVSYQGPLYDGRARTKGNVRVDISTRRESIDKQRELVRSEYDDLRPFVVTVISLEHLLAEKVRALFMRSKARDLYDLWFLTQQGVQVDKGLVKRKLALFSVSVSQATLDEALQKAQAEWNRDLRPLLPQMVPLKDAMMGLAPVFSELLS
jgi:predicted nucleotidyltransferase component of viral defense system